LSDVVCGRAFLGCQITESSALHYLERAYYQTMPKSDIIFNVLYQMGIYPNIRVFRFEMLHRFTSLDGAADYFAGKFNALSSYSTISV